jgi:outer membrane protein assembly factor BamE (lipoprotein component of BamABCDE complex)
MKKGTTMRIVITAAALLSALAVAGCQSAADHAASVHQGQEAGDRMTVGTVQREIRVGMTNAEVIQSLGAPNMVTTDEQRRENWVYDKIATDTVYSTSSGGVSALVLAGGMVGGALLGALPGVSAQSSAGAVSRTQRTLTVVVKFDGAGRVRDFAYRSSSF